MCTNTSLPPSSGWMKPKPLSGLNHFTVPVAMRRSPWKATTSGPAGPEPQPARNQPPRRRRNRMEERAPMSGVEDNPAKGRFEMASGDAVAFVEYTRAGHRIALLHTEVPEALSGQGVGSKLARGALDAVRAEGLKVVPRCGFVAAYVERHPEYRDLLDDGG